MGLFSPSGRPRDVIALPHQPVLWKFSFDNRYIFSHKNEGFFFQPLSVDDPQSPSHVITYAVAEERECNELLLLVHHLSGVNNFLAHFDQHHVVLDDCFHAFDFIICADWVGLIYELNGTPPNSAAPTAQPCWCCAITKQVLKLEWWENPFTEHHVRNDIDCFPRASLPSVPLHKRRYCWMHGVTRMLSHLIYLLYFMLPTTGTKQKQFLQVVQKISPKWLPHPKKSALQAKQMKHFIRTDHAHHIVAIFDDLAPFPGIKWPLPERELNLSPRAQCDAVFDAARVYHDFASTEWHSQQAFTSLWQARTLLLGFLAANRKPLTPTFHYMTNEAVYFAAHDGTAYFTLQEAIEHQNHLDKLDVQHTTAAPVALSRFQSRWQQLLHYQALVRAVRALVQTQAITTHSRLLMSVHDVSPLMAIPALLQRPRYFDAFAPIAISSHV